MINFIGEGFGALAVLAVLLWGVFVSIFWMVCGWRAMRAHERISHSLQELSSKRDQL